MIKKEYKCCICGKILDRKPHRLVHQEFQYLTHYGLYKNKYNYDFCTRCFSTYISWIKQRRKEVKDNDKRELN